MANKYVITFYKKPKRLHIAQRKTVTAPTAVVARSEFRRYWAGGRGVGRKHEIKDYTITDISRA